MRFFAFLAALWVASGLQVGMNLRCDLPLVILVLASLGLPRPQATGFGFITGLFQGGLAMANLTGYAISRTIAGFAVSSMVGLGLQPGAIVAGVTALLTTIAAQLILMLIAPPGALPAFLLDTIFMAMYNGVIAIVLYFPFRKLIGPVSR